MPLNTVNAMSKLCETGKRRDPSSDHWMLNPLRRVNRRRCDSAATWRQKLKYHDLAYVCILIHRLVRKHCQRNASLSVAVSCPVSTQCLPTDVHQLQPSHGASHIQLALHHWQSPRRSGVMDPQFRPVCPRSARPVSRSAGEQVERQGLVVGHRAARLHRLVRVGVGVGVGLPASLPPRLDSGGGETRRLPLHSRSAAPTDGETPSDGQ